jgi:hypothetical protein
MFSKAWKFVEEASPVAILCFAIVLGSAIFGFIRIAQAEWTPPTQNPPADDISPPLNTSSVGQYKEGALRIGEARDPSAAILEVKGGSRFEGGILQTTGGADLQALVVQGNSLLNGNLTVEGGTTLNGDLTVAAGKTTTLGGPTTVNDQLKVNKTDDTALISTLTTTSSIADLSAVSGVVKDEGGYGIRGRQVNASAQRGAGVLGEGQSVAGVWGKSNNSYGVWGESEDGFGVYGSSKDEYGVSATSETNHAIYAQSTNANADIVAIYGENVGGGSGVYGVANAVGASGLYGVHIGSSIDPQSPVTGVLGLTSTYNNENQDWFAAGVLGQAADIQANAGKTVRTYGIFGRAGTLTGTDPGALSYAGFFAGSVSVGIVGPLNYTSETALTTYSTSSYALSACLMEDTRTEAVGCAQLGGPTYLAYFYNKAGQSRDVLLGTGVDLIGSESYGDTNGSHYIVGNVVSLRDAVFPARGLIMVDESPAKQGTLYRAYIYNKDWKFDEISSCQEVSICIDAHTIQHTHFAGSCVTDTQDCPNAIGMDYCKAGACTSQCDYQGYTCIPYNQACGAVKSGSCSPASYCCDTTVPVQ